MSDLELLPLNHPMMKVPPDEFDFEKEDAKEFAELIWNKQKELGGVGLSANQVGRNARMFTICLLYTSPSPRDLSTSRMPSSA